MPVPKVNPEEEQQDYVSRCMGSDAMQKYDKEQRSAVCFNTFRETKKSYIAKGMRKLEKVFTSFISSLEKEQVRKRFIDEIPVKVLNDFSEEGRGLFKTIYIKNRIDKNSLSKSLTLAKSYTERNDKGAKTKTIILKEIQKQLSKMINKKKDDKKCKEKKDLEIEGKNISPVGDPNEDKNLNNLLGK